MTEPSITQVRVRDLKKRMPFAFETGAHHKIVLVRSRAFVLDTEDQHFNTNRCVLLPDLAGADGPAVLDKRRVKGLDVIYAALVHAAAHASQGLLVAGHTDPSGKAGYNRRLSEARAQNVSLLLRGRREDWRQQASKQDAVDDYQAVLKWQSSRSGWNCDPGAITNRRDRRTKAAIIAFQTKYNQFVQSAKDDKLDSPYKTTITVDGKVGPETWGAFYDIYMSELMSLLEIDAYSELETRQKKLKAASGMRDWTGCGEHVPFDPAARDPYEKAKDEHLEGPPHHTADRRVEILFFDPGEEVELPCKAKTADCKPPECLLYGDHRFRLHPIGIPKGLALMEANLRLTFVDPQGKIRPFPKGVEVEVRFGDPADLPADASSGKSGDTSDSEEDLAVSQEPVVETGDDGLLQFAVARRASTLFLRFLAGDKPFITCKPGDLAAQGLASEDDLAKAVGEGRVCFRLPASFTTLDGRWAPAAGLKFASGMFTDINNRQTQIGDRGTPAELKLEVAWQFFRFDYYDRWACAPASVPQPRSKDAGGADVLPLALEGYVSLLPPEASPDKPEAMTVWDLKSGDATVHCLGWVRRLVDGASKKRRELPDKTCMVRFFVNDGKSLFIRTDGDGKSANPPRAFELLEVDDTKVITANAERLRYYDLPDDWRSNDYPSRLADEDPSKVRPFQDVVATKSTLDKPYVLSLDTLVLSSDKPTEPDAGIVWNDSQLENRFSIRDGKLAVWKPHLQDTYFTKLDDLAPKPTGPVLCDLPVNARFITRGKYLFHAFDSRLPAAAPSKGFPVGARLARRYQLDASFPDERKPFFHLTYEYRAPKPDGSSAAAASTGHSAIGLLRCCGHEGNVESFAFFNYATLRCNFAPTPPFPQSDAEALPSPPTATVADEHVRKCLLAVNARWNGADGHNKAQPIFEVGDPVTAKGTWTALMLPGASAATNAALLTIDVYKKIRAGIQVGPATGHWALEDMSPTSGGSYDGYFTVAHELGHVMGQPDEYINTDYEPSLNLANLTESWRSPGIPYGLDEPAMMTTNRLVRTRSYWHVLLWAQDRGAFPGNAKLMVTHGTHEFTADITRAHASRVQWPVHLTANPNANASAAGSPWSGVAVGSLGLCDEFLYVTGKDGWTAGDLGGSSPIPYDGFVVVRVKMAWTFRPSQDFDTISSLLSRANEGIGAAFNKNASRRLVFRGVFDGKPVRLRVLFAPRFVSRTFPTGGESATKYLESIDYPKIATPLNAGNHTDRVRRCVDACGLHAEIEVVDKGSPGVAAGASPRIAQIRGGSFLLVFTDPKFDGDVLRVFGQLVGLPDQNITSPAVFQPLANALRPRLIAIPEYA